MVAAWSPAAAAPPCGYAVCVGAWDGVQRNVHERLAGGVPPDVAPDKLAATISASFVSDYVSRGITWTEGRPALQAGARLDYAASPAITLSGGLWSSNLYVQAEGAMKPELDTYIAVAHIAAKGSIGLTATYETFPGVAHALGYDNIELRLRADRLIGERLTLYSTASYAIAFGAREVTFPFGQVGLHRDPGATPLRLGFDAHFGRQWFEDRAFFAITDYDEYGFTLISRWRGTDLALGIASSDLGRAQCYGGTKLCGTRLIGSLTHFFAL